MKKKLFSITLMGCLMLAATGCTNAIPDMTDEQMTMVTEYAAALLLKYDADYEPMLLNDERLAQEEEMQRRVAEEAKQRADAEAEKETAEQENADRENGGTGESAESAERTDPAEFLELSGITVSCNGVEFYDSYPDSGDDLFFAVNASEGCKLAVIRLTMTNNNAEACNVDILNKNVRFKASFNGGEYHNTMVTMLENDFSVYTGTLAPGEAADTILMVDLKTEECNPVESLNLYIKYQGKNIKTAVYP